MMSQEELPPFLDEEQLSEDIVGNLLQETYNDKEIMKLEEPTNIKEQSREAPINLEEDLCLPLHLELLQSEQSDYSLSEKPFFDVSEEDPVVTGMNTKKTEASPLLNYRKDSKIDKMAYLQETREAKIERYRQKKSRRIWDRKIFYDCRKLVADKRMRVNGRFAKKSPIGQGKESIQNTCSAIHDFDILKELTPQCKSFQDFCL